MKIRGFEVVKRLEEYKDEIVLPTRSTKASAGYDFVAVEDMEIPSIFSQLGSKAVSNMFSSWTFPEIKPTLVKLGVKAYMQDYEVLCLYNRSSNPKKLGLIVANSVGVVDSDYYENPDNDGEICVLFYNIWPYSVHIKKGDKICQGIFSQFLKADNDKASGERLGGYGSTGK